MPTPNNTMLTPTHCPYCALQCGMNLSGSPITVLARPDFPTNKGGLCQKGWSSSDLLTHSERLQSPLMRLHKGAPLVPVTWEQALERIKSEVVQSQKEYGLDSVGVFGGGGLTNEKAYMLGKFARVALRTSQIDYNGRFCMASAASANIRSFGLDRGLPFPLEDIAKTDVVLLVGSNVAETMPPIMQYFDMLKENGGKLIVVDPRATPTALGADLHLQPTPGTDLALANGLLHIAASEGLLDHDFIDARTSGYDAVRRTIASYWPDRVERITGIPVESLTKAARLIGTAKSAIILTSRGAEQQSKGVDTVTAFINLALALGKVGKPLCGYGCITGQGNGQGGREHGQKCDQLPGYRSITDPEHRAHIASVWNIAVDDLPGAGKSAYEMLDTLGETDGVRSLFVFGSNIAVSAPSSGHINDRLRALDFLVVADIFLSETAELADIVLPTAQWAEEEGTMTNLEGRVLRRKKAVEPPDGVWTDLQIFAGIAAKLGKAGYFTADPQVVFAELCRASAGGVADYSGITYRRIEEEQGVFWPCPDKDHPGTPRLFLESFATDDGKARFHSVAHRPAAEEPDDQYPLYLTTGRVMAQYQSGTQTRRVKRLTDTAPGPFVELHPLLAASFGIADGDIVTLSTRRGEAKALARLTTTIRQDTLFMPFHWSGSGQANLLTNPALDPISKMPEFKVCAVSIAK